MDATVFLKAIKQLILTKVFQSNYTLIFHCFLAHLKTATPLILLWIFFGDSFLYFFLIFN